MNGFVGMAIGLSMFWLLGAYTCLDWLWFLNIEGPDWRGFSATTGLMFATFGFMFGSGK